MKKIKMDIIKICAIIITICLLYLAIINIYSDLKYNIKDQDGRKSVCDSKGLVYLKTIQSSNEVVRCCKIDQREIVGCSDFLK